jgi:hypothetical protein
MNTSEARRAGDGRRSTHAPAGDSAASESDDFNQQFDSFDDALRQTVEGALNINTWTSGARMGELEERLHREVDIAMKNESEMAPRVLKTLQKTLEYALDTSKESGIFHVTPEQIFATYRNVLFNGLTEACDGTRVTYDTLPITVIQIGLCMTSYLDDGNPTSIGHRMYRHDILRKNGDPDEDVRAFIEQRSRHRSQEDGGSVGLPDMLVRAIMEYGERALLAEKSTKLWRMGHGVPMPYEMITGSGQRRMITASLEMLPKLLAEHKRFIFVPSDTTDKEIKTIANALRPLQYALLMNTKYVMNRYLRESYRGRYRELRPRLEEFRDEVASKVLIGVYKVSAFSPGNIFYCHEDYAHEAALIAMADSALQEHRGFPNLIDIADRICRGTFDASGIAASVNAVFAEKGQPYQYLLERATRR